MAYETAEAFVRLLELARSLGPVKAAHMYTNGLCCVEGAGFHLSLQLEDGGAADVCQVGGAGRCLS